jgi:hypothetical protein
MVMKHVNLIRLLLMILNKHVIRDRGMDFAETYRSKVTVLPHIVRTLFGT